MSRETVKVRDVNISNKKSISGTMMRLETETIVRTLIEKNAKDEFNPYGVLVDGVVIGEGFYEAEVHDFTHVAMTHTIDDNNSGEANFLALNRIKDTDFVNFEHSGVSNKINHNLIKLNEVLASKNYKASIGGIVVHVADKKKEIYAYNVGEIFIYHANKNNLNLINTIHTEKERYAKIGKFSQEIIDSMETNEVYSFLGNKEKNEVSETFTNFESGDYVIMTPKKIQEDEFEALTGVFKNKGNITKEELKEVISKSIGDEYNYAIGNAFILVRM
ncbi:hypothetical protein RJG79_02505 [Mycoplasmatota bacterium WC44]